MATPKKPAQPAPTSAAAAIDEPVNSEQLEAREAAQAAPEGAQQAPGADLGELEERTAEAEQRAEAAERRNEELAAELSLMKEQLAVLMRQSRSPQGRADAAQVDAVAAWDSTDSDAPLFDEDRPHGVVMGDTEVAYVQDGHQFGRDRRYLRTEKHRGTPRAFNPRLVGLTKPRPNQQAIDPLDWARGRD